MVIWTYRRGTLVHQQLVLILLLVHKIVIDKSRIRKADSTVVHRSSILLLSLLALLGRVINHRAVN